MNRITKKQESNVAWMCLSMYLLCALAFTGVVLLLLALLLYKINLSEQVITISIIASYVIAGFLGGFLAGRKRKQKRFLWGLFMGVAYFLVILLVTIVAKGGLEGISDSIFTTLILCAGGGMLGGMLS